MYTIGRKRYKLPQVEVRLAAKANHGYSVI